MKKLAIILLLIGLCLILTYCLFHPAKEWEEGMLRDTFFGEDYLAERGIADFPIPKLEGSYFDAEKNILYLNLSQEELDAYTNTVAAYLRDNDELKVKGYHCGVDIQALLVIPLRVYQLASLNVEEISFFDSDERIFGFSTEDADYSGYRGEYTLEKPKFVSLKWEPSTKKSGASYTTVMQFPSYYGAEFLTCYHGHDLESVTYPVPGPVVYTTTVHTCTRCGEQTREGYGYGDELKKFSWTVVEGTEYLTSGVYNNEYRGSVVEIATKAPEGTKLKMTVGSTDIPVIKEVDGKQIFAFIMPYGDVKIKIEAVGEHEHTGEMYSGEEAHWYEYTCGCESPDIAELHYDHDEDGVCDVCKYTMQPQ